MKKIFAGFFVMFLLSVGITVFAESGIAGHIYSTDILAFVNGKPIEGFNIGGKTVVIAEDLNSYGFNCNYNDEERKLDILAYFYELGNDIKFAEIPRGQVGKIVGDIYNTDIKVFFNGIEIKGYNLGGRTAVCIEDIGDTQDSPHTEYGYSKYLGKSEWNENDRTIALEMFKRNDNKVMGKLARVSYTFKDNILYAYPDECSSWLEIRPIKENPAFKDYIGGSYSDGFEKDVIAPLYIDVAGKIMQVGLAVFNPNNEYSPLYNEYEPLMYFYDTEKTLELTSKAKSPQVSYDEAVKYFSEKYEIVNRLDNDDYTALHINDAADGVLFIYINKNGGYIMDDFFKSYGDREVKVWFKENEKNIVLHSVYPFGGPHGTTTMRYESELDSFDYE